MRPTAAQAETIVRIARLHIGKEWPRFKCLELVRNIYSEVGIRIPPISPQHRPPQLVNLSRAEVASPPPGHLIFLRNKTTPSKRPWTHVAILVHGRAIVHRSRFFGETIVLSPLDEAFRFYDFVAS